MVTGAQFNARPWISPPELSSGNCQPDLGYLLPAAWDQDATPSQRRAAVALCRTCPVLRPCRAWVESLPARLRPGGVVAGRLYYRQAR